ncbi:hypothetical protein [Kribbella ginsengisoli]|uniref:Uncharacterized protein n=1 Tax=Kribbella ginsengisoli TaxID=363865 RepID=A0ABP6XCC8_9ACTN
MNTKLALVATVAATLTLAGCGGSSDDNGTAGPAPTTPASPTATPTPGPGDTPPPDTAGTPTPPATPSSTPKPSILPKPTKPVPTAADGTNYKACADSRCEVAVRTGTRLQVKRSTLGFTSILKIDRVSNGTVAYSADGGCCSISTSAQGPGQSYTLNSLKVTTIAVSGRTAVLRLKPA